MEEEDEMERKNESKKRCGAGIGEEGNGEWTMIGQMLQRMVCLL